MLEVRLAPSGDFNPRVRVLQKHDQLRVVAALQEQVGRKRHDAVLLCRLADARKRLKDVARLVKQPPKRNLNAPARPAAPPLALH